MRVICRACGDTREQDPPLEGRPCLQCGAPYISWPHGIPGLGDQIGKYDGELDELFAKLRAPRMMLLLVFEGPNGNGFSVAGEAQLIPEIPRMLRVTAKRIEEEIENRRMEELRRCGNH